MSPELIERLEALRDFHLDAATRLRAYADDDGLRESDVKHYNKRADVYAAHAETVTEVLDGQV